jgi:hypothetical protein
MSGENRDDLIIDTYISENTENNSVVPISFNLNSESKALIEQIVAEKDDQKLKDLTQLFNVKQNKKTMARVDKLSELLDTITDQALTRFTNRPDEISNKELFDGLKIVQDLIERGQKQVSGAGEMPLIQFNQQTNEVNIGSNTASNLNRDSRERVKSAVISLLSSITANTTEAPVAGADFEDKTEKEEITDDEQ